GAGAGWCRGVAFGSFRITERGTRSARWRVSSPAGAKFRVCSTPSVTCPVNQSRATAQAASSTTSTASQTSQRRLLPAGRSSGCGELCIGPSCLTVMPGRLRHNPRMRNVYAAIQALLLGAALGFPGGAGAQTQEPEAEAEEQAEAGQGEVELVEAEPVDLSATGDAWVDAQLADISRYG